MKPNWKKKYEETAGLLKLCREDNVFLNMDKDRWESESQRSQKLLMDRPIREKIVEKEILPMFVLWILMALIGIELMIWMLANIQIKHYTEPILSPYPAYITKYIYDDENLKICKDAWREDQAIIRRLKGRMK